MTKKKKLLQRIIALVLVAALWWQTDSMRFFVTAFAAETENVVSENTNLSSDDELSESDTTDVPVTVLGEVETLRTEGEKHFRMSDGSFMAVSYGMPVHYQDEDGEWQDIDNRMVLTEDQASYQTYNLQSTTNFASSLNEGILFETSYDDTSLTMSLLDTIQADNLMKGEAELEIESELETEIELKEEVEIEAELEIEVEIETETESEFEIETKTHLEESMIETELDIEELEQTVVESIESTTELEQEIITEMVNPDLLIFDRTAIADTTIETEPVLGTVGGISDTDDSTKGWSMEDILPENIQDSLLYEDVFPGVDLLYTKYSHNVKEQIIVNSPQAAYRYDFKLTLDGVEAVLNEDGSVSLVEEENHENEIYYIPAPFMQDADGIVSYDVEYMLTTVSDGVILTVVADAEWMNEDGRAFPVAIDPTIIVNVAENKGKIYSVYTAQGSPTSSYNGSTFYTGYTEWHSMKEYRAFLHFNNLPEIPSGMTVVNGQLALYLYGFSNRGYTEVEFGIYEVTSEKPSTASDYQKWIDGLTWNTMPVYDTDNLIDYTNVSESNLNDYRYWDITELIKKWYIEDTENRTVALTMVPGEYDDTHYVEAQFCSYDTIAPPAIAVSYRSTAGIEPYYTYQTLGAGGAGTAYIADATGQLKIVNPLISYASTINPFSLSLVYNSDYFSESLIQVDYQPPSKMGQENTKAGIAGGSIAMKLGQGWTLDIIQTMHTETIGETEYICYTDGDGTKHYFIKDDKKNNADDSDKIFYYDEDGLGLKAEITNTAKTSFVMYDDAGNRWTFTNGRLAKIADEALNAYIISWNSSNQIDKISQLNRGNAMTALVAEFSYSGEYVSSIKDAAGNVYTLTYDSGRLSAISMNGTEKCSYAYYNGNQICTMKDSESSYRLEYGINHGRIDLYLEAVGDEAGNVVYIDYPNYSKTVYRSGGKDHTIGGTDDLYVTYLFDHTGRTVNAYITDIFKNILGATNAVYTVTNSSETSVDKTANRTQKIGNLGVAAPSLITDGGFENESWSLLSQNASFDTEGKRTGDTSLKITPSTEESTIYAQKNAGRLFVGHKYTVSAYINTSDCSESDLDGVFVSVIDGENNYYKGQGINFITSEATDNGWARVSFTFRTTSDTDHYICIGSEHTTGTVYVDDVQLVKGETAGTYNLLENGSMEFGIYGWISQVAENMSLVSGRINEVLEEGTSGGTVLKLTGDPDTLSGAYQEVELNLSSKETYVLSGWAKGNAVPDNLDTADTAEQDGKKQFGLRAVITYKDTVEKEYHYTPFCDDISEWQFASLTIVPKEANKTVESIKVVCVYEGNANVAYFDNLCLSLEPAQTMKYDTEGNLQSVNTPGLTEDLNTYEGGNLIKSITGGNGTYTYTYDDTYEHRLTSATDSVITQDLSYDRFGNVLETTLKSNNTENLLAITTSAAYSTDGNRITELTDAAGNQISYDYGNSASIMYGIPTATTDGKGTTTSTVFDSKGRTTEVAVEELVGLLYTYDKGMLASIERNDLGAEETSENSQQYRFTYDIFGQVTAVYIGERLLVSYEYYNNNGNLRAMDYANGAWVSYGYDILGRVIQKYYSDDRTVDYFYDNNGQICSVKDSVNGNIYYTYDRLGRLVYYRNDASGVCCGYTYDSNGRLVHTDYQLDGFGRTSERYAYNSSSTDDISDGTLTSMQLATSHGLSRKFDYLQRLIEHTLPGGLKENYTYAAGEEENTTTTLVSGKQNTLNGTLVSDFEYEYDENGNITRIMDDVTNEVVTYYYDELNQLIRASHSSLRMEIYSYDAHGNLLTFNNGITSHTYTYGNSDWKDLLTAVDGVTLTYDEIGNPLTYYNGESYSLSWTGGRKLATITTDGKTTSYLYDADGIRVRKTNSDGSYIIYVNADGKTLAEKHYSADGELTKTLRYIYDENGSVCGYVSNSADGGGIYHFIKNLQGDVIRVYRVSDKAIVASYSYDSWGNIISATGEKAEENPFRYRGYYYDNETGFYYVSSRYYDPEIGRFINADTTDILGVSSHLYDKNLYAYCDNNPVSRKDATGAVWETVFDVVSLGFSIAEVAMNPYDVGAWIGLVGDTVDLIPFVTGVGEVTRGIRFIDKAGNTLEIAKAVDFTDDAKKTINGLDSINGFTKSTRAKGIDIHKGYKKGPDFNSFNKEFSEVAGIRPDYYDGTTIFELKPFNPHSAKAGIRQLRRYNSRLGGGNIMRLEFY